MTRSVPLARRTLFNDRRRVALSTAGIATAFVLVLLLEGIFAGASSQVTAALRASPADIIVSQRGVRTMHMSTSALDPQTVDAVARTDGVTWAEPVNFAQSVVTSAQGEQLSYIFGYDTITGHAGPRRIEKGVAPTRGQVVLDKVAARRLDVTVGGTVTLLGKPFTISGLSTGGTSIVNSSAFLTLADFQDIRGPAIAYVFVAAEPGRTSAVAELLTNTLADTTVQTRQQFVGQEGGLVGDMATQVLSIMTTIALLIALAVIGLSLFTLTLARQRDYAVIEAIGASRRRLVKVVLQQAGWSVILAFAVGIVASFAIGRLVEQLVPTIEILITPSSVLRLGVVATLVAAVGAIAAMRTVLIVDPATAFRRVS